MRQPSIFEIDGVEKAGDGEGQGNKRKAAGAEENEDDDLLLEDAEEEPAVKVTAELPEEAPERQVDYFA